MGGEFGAYRCGNFLYDLALAYYAPTWGGPWGWALGYTETITEGRRGPISKGLKRGKTNEERELLDVRS